MGNIVASLKRLLANKNTVTFLGVIAAVIVLYVGYSIRVGQAIKQIPIPYAKKEIGAMTEITEDMIGTVDVPSTLVSKHNLISSKQQLVDMYVTSGTSIPEGGFFHKNQVVQKGSLPNSVLEDIPDGYTIYSLSVNNHSTYGNSIYPGDYIDLYFKSTDDTGRVQFGKFIESIQVLAVRDSSGRDVFSQTQAGVPAELLFSVTDEYFQLLRKADYINGYSIEITPVPRNKSYTAKEGDTSIVSNDIKQFILAKSSQIDSNLS